MNVSANLLHDPCSDFSYSGMQEQRFGIGKRSGKWTRRAAFKASSEERSWTETEGGD